MVCGILFTCTCVHVGASEPKNMAYMSRLGIWGEGTQFPAFQDFIKSVERRYVYSILYCRKSGNLCVRKFCVLKLCSDLIFTK